MKIPVAILSFSLILTPFAAAQSADASPALEVAAAVKKEIDARQRVLRELAQFKKHKDLLAALDSFSIMCAATIKETLERRGGSVSNDDMQNHDDFFVFRTCVQVNASLTRALEPIILNSGN